MPTENPVLGKGAALAEDSVLVSGLLLASGHADGTAPIGGLALASGPVPAGGTSVAPG